MAAKFNMKDLLNAQSTKTPDAPDSGSRSIVYWVSILGEEFGEYCEAVNETMFDNGLEAREKGGYDNMVKELAHVAAVAVAAMECLMRENNHDL